MITRKKLCQFLDDLYTPQLFSDYCPNGLQVEGCEEIKKIGLAVTANVETIKKAVANECQALIVHHGMFWTKDSYPVVGIKKEKLQLLLKNELSLISYHLPMDAHTSFGNNWKAAEDLGMTDLTPFGMFEKSFIGVKGVIKSQTRNDFKSLLENYYKHVANVAFGGNEIIESVAIVSGGAYRLVSEAASSSINAFVTGSFDLPAWDLSFEEKVNFYALGHHATERVGPLALKKKLEATFKIPCCFIEDDNPF